MRCLTIRQPWATLIIEGHKKYEFRTWKTNYRGKFYIHAGLTMEKENQKRFENYQLNYVSGAIIGEAEVVDCIFVDQQFKKKLLEENNEIYKNSEGYAFVLKNVIKYDEPIFCKGKLGFWNKEKS